MTIAGNLSPVARRWACEIGIHQTRWLSWNTLNSKPSKMYHTVIHTPHTISEIKQQAYAFVHSIPDSLIINPPDTKLTLWPQGPNMCLNITTTFDDKVMLIVGTTVYTLIYKRWAHSAVCMYDPFWSQLEFLIKNICNRVCCHWPTSQYRLTLVYALCDETHCVWLPCMYMLGKGNMVFADMIHNAPMLISCTVCRMLDRVPAKWGVNNLFQSWKVNKADFI